MGQQRRGVFVGAHIAPDDKAWLEREAAATHGTVTQVLQIIIREARIRRSGTARERVLAALAERPRTLRELATATGLTLHDIDVVVAYMLLEVGAKIAVRRANEGNERVYCQK
jgi:hypothetical protein